MYSARENENILNFRLIVRAIGDFNKDKGKQKETEQDRRNEEETELKNIGEAFGTNIPEQQAFEEKIQINNDIMNTFLKNLSFGKYSSSNNNSEAGPSRKIVHKTTVDATDSQGNATLQPEQVEIDIDELSKNNSEITTEQLFPLWPAQEQQLMRNRSVMQDAARRSIQALLRANEFFQTEGEIRDDLETRLAGRRAEIREAAETHDKNSLMALVYDYVRQHPYQAALFGSFVALLAYLGIIKPKQPTIVYVSPPAVQPPVAPPVLPHINPALENIRQSLLQSIQTILKEHPELKEIFEHISPGLVFISSLAIGSLSKILKVLRAIIRK